MQADQENTDIHAHTEDKDETQEPLVVVIPFDGDATVYEPQYMSLTQIYSQCFVGVTGG